MEFTTVSSIAAIILLVNFTLWQVLTLYVHYNNWMLWLAWKHRNHNADAIAIDDPLPLVTVQLPVYNEAAVIERLLLAVGQLDYPADLFEIQLLDDSTDNTPELANPIVEELRSQGLSVAHIRRTNRKGYKAGALHEGLQSARGEFIFILDADFVPAPDTLRKLIARFDDDNIAMVQGRWSDLHPPRSLVERCTSYWVGRHFEIEQFARSRSGHFFHFNGTAGVWRRSAIDNAGGWTADTLAGDLDLSLRSWRQEQKFVYAHDILVPADQPMDMLALKIQQGRWSQGAFQVFRKFTPTLKTLPWRKRIPIFMQLSGYSFPVMLLWVALLAGTSAWATSIHPRLGFWMADFPAIGFVVGLVAQVIFRWVTRGPRAGLLEIEAATVGLGLGLHIMRNGWRGIRHSGGEFVRTPKHRIQSGTFSQDNILEIMAACLLLFNAAYAIYIGQYFNAPLPIIGGVGLLFCGLATAFPNLGSIQVEPPQSNPLASF